MQLHIKGKNVSLRPQAQAVGRVIARANTDDVFIAKKQLIVNDHDHSEWYEIMLTVDAQTNRITAFPGRILTPPWRHWTKRAPTV